MVSLHTEAVTGCVGGYRGSRFSAPQNSISRGLCKRDTVTTVRFMMCTVHQIFLGFSDHRA
jgi:hypothetical protein